MEQKEIRRRKAAIVARDHRRKSRRKAVRMEKTIIAVICTLVICGGTLTIWNMLPGIKVAKQLDTVNQLVEKQSYEEALASCEQALEIDSKSVKAYKTMAGVYLTKEDRVSAEQILYRGWETTGDESLLQEYRVHLLNDAVADINSQNCTLDTLSKCVQALEQGESSKECYNLLDACYHKLFAGEETDLFCSNTTTETCGFNQYLEIMNRMLKVYETLPTEELKTEILKYASPENSELWLEVKHLPDYSSLLNRVKTLGEEDSVNNLIACIDKALWVQDTFEGAFTIFESGDFAAIREFMQTDTYISVRDAFINDSMEYWSGKTYIPVSREKMKFILKDGKWSFAFADYEDCPETAGIIQVWGAKQEDAGVQRLCIAYEPASLDGEYYPHTTYEFIYLYSNVQIGKEYVPQMNYRFETRVATPEGTTTQLVGDWGGEHEWTTEY